MDNDYMKRGYLLPEGCNDLIDVLRLKPRKEHPLSKADEARFQLLAGMLQQQLNPLVLPAALPPIVGELTVGDQTPVHKLAVLLKKQPVQIVADLLQLGVLATVNQLLPFDISAQVLRKYGYRAKKAA